MTGLFPQKIGKDQSRDTGMAMVLLALLLFALTRRDWLLYAALVLHVVNMTVPQIYRPLAVVWLGFSHLLGLVVSKVVLTVIFYLVVTPIGTLRKLMGKDSLRLRAFRASEESAMVERNHLFVARDIETPY
jgi:hypothetical protein